MSRMQLFASDRPSNKLTVSFSETLMAECFRCGNAVRAGHGYRREVFNGHSSRFYFGKRVSQSSRRSYAVRTVCANCATRMDRRKTNRMLTWAGIILFLVIVVKMAPDSPGSSAIGRESLSGTSPASASAFGLPTDPLRSETTPAPEHRIKHRRDKKHSSKDTHADEASRSDGLHNSH
jgi:uncharacterized C2H2 Zn-finger protein